MMRRMAALLTACLMVAATLLSSCESTPGTSSAAGESRGPDDSQIISGEETTSQESSASEVSIAESSQPELSPEESSPEESAEPEPPLDIIDYSELEVTPAAVTYEDWTPNLLGRGTIPVLTVVVTFTDGLEIDKAAFEDRMEGEYDQDECIRSVASYYKFNSYGRVSFDFHFVYYDSGMTCSEAWHYVNDEDERGFFRGNDFIAEIFKDIRSHPSDFGIGDFRTLDGNGDGFVDLPMFLFAEDSSKIIEGEKHRIYGGARGNFTDKNPAGNVDNPNINYFLKMPYDTILMPPETESDRTSSGVRGVIHEIGHMFGLHDYYDSEPVDYEAISVLGTFDMQEAKFGDWNPFSKFSTGFLDPYVIEDLEDSITIRLGCSIEQNQAILIPTSAGWNGTPFDEYILVDVMAPVGATGFDWDYAHSEWDQYTERTNKEGGVRILHVDARLILFYYEDGHEEFVDPWKGSYYAHSDEWVQVRHAFSTTNATDHMISGRVLSRYFHLVEMVPSDGSSCYRVCTHPEPAWSLYHFFTSSDLFGPGDVFSMETCRGAFAAYPEMNNGSDLEYSVTVEAYDPVKHEAIVTIARIG
ncbi:MAG: hypothetical protein IJM90_06465 [Firmicutes bacterium]|nr:hypothetical protein [Bacillota bacterium]